MADITFATIEAALVTRLQTALTYVEDRNIASYAGQIEDANNGLPVEAPAALVMFENFSTSPEDSSRHGHRGQAQFSVIVIGDSYAGGTVARTSTTNGAYKLCDDVVAALDDNSLSISGFIGVTFAGIEMVSVTKIRAIYKVKFNAILEVSR